MRRGPAPTVYLFAGEIDLDCADTLREAVDRGREGCADRRWTSAVEFIDSSGTGIFVRLALDLKHEGTPLVAATSSAVRGASSTAGGCASWSATRSSGLTRLRSPGRGRVRSPAAAPRRRGLAARSGKYDGSSPIDAVVSVDTYRLAEQLDAVAGEHVKRHGRAVVQVAAKVVVLDRDSTRRLQSGPGPLLRPRWRSGTPRPSVRSFDLRSRFDAIVSGAIGQTATSKAADGDRSCEARLRASCLATSRRLCCRCPLSAP